MIGTFSSCFVNIWNLRLFEHMRGVVALEKLEAYWNPCVELIVSIKEHSNIVELKYELEINSEQESEDVKPHESVLLTVPTAMSKVLMRFAKAVQAAIAEVGNLPPFQLLVVFFQQLESAFTSIQRDQMQTI